MRTEEVTRDVWRIPLIGPDMLNVYIAKDVLIDAGGRAGRRKLLGLLETRDLAGHALTHAHPDHQGCSHAVCERFRIPLYCGEGDREAMNTGDVASLMPRPDSPLARLAGSVAGPAHEVSGSLSDGDEIGGLEVIETPGHTPGHLAFWKAEDRLLILGDVLFHRNPVSLRRGLSEPFAFATYDRQANLDSARRLADLQPAIVCFGHGAPLRDGDAFRRFVDRLCA